MKHNDLMEEIFLALDGELDTARMEALGKLIQEDEEALAVYRDLAHFHNALEIRMQANRANESRGVVPIDRILFIERRRWMRFSAAAAVFLMFAGLSFLWWQISERKAPQHAFHISEGAVFSLTGSKGKPSEGSGVFEKGSRLRVEAGTVECWFKEGVHAMFQGPCELTVKGDNAIALEEGAGWFHVAKGAEGFTVTTPEMEVKDLGTEFGVLSRPDNADEVHVFSGKVGVTTRGPRKDTMELTAGASFYSDPIGRLKPVELTSPGFFAKLANQTKTPQPENMKHKITTLSVLTMAATANAATLASFDLGDTGNVQAGFTPIGIAGDSPGGFTGPASGTTGGITLQITGGLTLVDATTKNGAGNYNSTGSLVSRDRLSPNTDNGTFTYSELYRTFLTANNFLGIQLSGLAPATEYAITFYSYDNSGSRTQTFTNATGSQTNSGTVSYSAGATFGPTTPNSVFSTTLNGTTDASGRLFFTGSGTGTGGSSSQGILNGLVVNSIPEPGSAMLLFIGSLGLLRRKR